jgi:nicotinamide-nucleotide amidase
MKIEIINSGSELLLGRILNTHQQWLASRLVSLGYKVSRQLTVGDSEDHIVTALKEALSRADLIITTGGLGPTSDDLTRKAIANLLGRELRYIPAIEASIEQFYSQRNRHCPPSARIQAQVPDGAIILPNEHGTAPGLILEVNPNPYRENQSKSFVVMLPGPPRELYPMFNKYVVPFIAEKFPLDKPFYYKIIKTTGQGESVIEEKISEPLKPLIDSGLELGLYAKPGEVEIKLAASNQNAQQLVDQAEKIIRQTLNPIIFCVGDENLETVVVKTLIARNETLAIAESCTGGFIAHRITNVPGASAVFLASFVTYSNDAKIKILGVTKETLDIHGAVSEPTAIQMAEGSRKITGATYSIAVTGIAGPTGGTLSKPIGTVYIALASERHSIVRKYFFPTDRETFKQLVSQQAIEVIRQNLISPILF